MSKVKTGPNVVHPERPSALGSRNSVNRNNRDEYFESQLIIDEEVDKILNHVEGKLPPEVLSKLHVAGNIKDLLHTYINQSTQNMLNRYIVTVEDELGKKYRNMIDKEEVRGLNKFTSRDISELLTNVSGVEMFNTSEFEKSIINIYGHAQGNVVKGVSELENETNSILRQKSDSGALLRGQNTYALVKCSFADDLIKPEYVHDTRISINILDHELTSPIFHYQIVTEKIIKDLVSDRIIELLDNEIDNISKSLLDEGREELSPNECVFEKFKYLDDYLSEDENSEHNKYSMVAEHILESVKGIGAVIDTEEYDSLNLRENIKEIVDEENIRNRGYNTAMNMITSILDGSKMSYQHVENFKCKRKTTIREYNVTNPLDIPDENFQIVLEFLDDNQLKNLRLAYDQQILEFGVEIEKVEKVIDYIYIKEYKKIQTRVDFEDMKKEYLSSASKEKDEGQDEDGTEQLWNELTFIEPDRTSVENDNYNYDLNYEKLLAQINRVYEKLSKTFKLSYPDERLVAESRIDALKGHILEFKRRINPFHVQPGIMLEIRFNTIKRKDVTMKHMSNVLNEFLHNISHGFRDQAFAYFHRRRSTDGTSIQDMDGTSTPQTTTEVEI